MAELKRFCKMPAIPPKVYGPGVSLSRMRAIDMHKDLWVNGTRLHYYFFESPKEWTTTDKEKEAVRRAFDTWKKLGIGLEFQEVSSPGDAEIRIGFLQGDGSWSFVGTYNLKIGRDQRTTNFGWDLTQDFDCALHEIGHAIGLQHEHQSPKAGIVWDEEAVYKALAAPPNEWSREETYENIIKN